MLLLMVFKIIAVVIFLNIFYLKLHKNNIFYFLKFIFNICKSKLSKILKNQKF